MSTDALACDGETELFPIRAVGFVGVKIEPGPSQPVAQEDDNQSLRRSFRVVIRLDDSDPERMRPGMSVRAEVLPLPLTDAIEVYNPTAAAIDIGGWVLSDSKGNFRKYRIPDDTMLPAGGYRVFDALQSLMLKLLFECFLQMQIQLEMSLEVKF